MVYFNGDTRKFTGLSGYAAIVTERGEGSAYPIQEINRPEIAALSASFNSLHRETWPAGKYVCE